MPRFKTATALLLGFAVAVATFTFGVGTSYADHPGDPTTTHNIQPVFVAGNPNLGEGCFRIDPPEGQTYPYASPSALDDFEITLTFPSANPPADPSNIGPTFDFTTTGGTVTSMIVKGGPDANSYTWPNPGVTSDTYLHSPVNHQNSQFYGLSHVDVCYDPAEPPTASISVEKTAEGSFTRSCTWDIDKSLADGQDAEISVEKGQTATIDYTVVLTGSCEDGDYTVSGAITIFNDGDVDVEIDDITDSLGVIADLSCDDGAFDLGGTLAPGESVDCTYSVSGLDGDETQNVATVDWSVDGEGQEAAVSEPALFTYVQLGETVNECVNLDDSLEGDLGEFCIDQEGDENPEPMASTFTINYSHTTEAFDVCGETTIDNTVTIVETEQTDEATVDVDVLCEELTVSKTVDTSYVRTHLWDISKSVDADELWLYADGSGDTTVEWTVDVTYEGYQDSDHNVSGTITIENTGDLDAVITDIEDVLGGTDIAVVCGDDDFALPYNLAVGATLTCTYDEDGEFLGNNVATVTTQRDSYDTTEAIVWGDPTTEVNATVTISDLSDLFGEVELGTVTAPDGNTFTYDKAFAWADFDECGTYVYNNTATIVETEQSDDASVTVNVQCVTFEGETAWAANGDVPGQFRYNQRGNWATYVQYAAKCTTLFAGQNTNVGTVCFSAVASGQVTITVTLIDGWDYADVGSNLKVQGYSSAPSGNPAPGRFANKTTCDPDESACQITVAANNFYGVHVDVGTWVADPEFGP